MRNHSPITLATKLQTVSSAAAIETRENNIFTIFPFVIAGTLQVETATAAGTVTAPGNATATVTDPAVTGSPVAVSFAVANGDTPTIWAAKARAALNLNAAVAAVWVAGGTGTAITLTRITPAANVVTLNLALATGTATGITAAPTSTDTLAGAASGTSMTLVIEGKSPNGDWHALATAVALSAAGAATPIQISSFCNEIRATLSVWASGHIVVTGLQAIRA